MGRLFYVLCKQQRQCESFFLTLKALPYNVTIGWRGDKMPFNSFENYPMSWRPNLDKTGRSFYQTLAQQLEADIQNGVLRPGTRLPPQRELADFLDINVSTVSKAFKQCELKGLLSATVGSGTFVAYDALSRDKLLIRHDSDSVINMGPTAPESSGNEFLLKMTQEMLGEAGAQRLFSYYAPGADEWQKDAAVKLMRYCGHHADRENILFSGGGQNALTAVLAAMFRRGDKIAVDDHTYPGVKTAAAMFGIQLVPVPGGSDGMDTEALETLCKTEKIRGIYMIPACHNPTTAIIPEEKRTQIARIVKSWGCILIEDGTYEILHSGSPGISARVPEQSVYIVSLSKGIAPGLRLAYLSVPAAWKAAAADALYSLNVATVPMMAELSARIISSGQFEAIINRHRQHTRERNKIVSRYLKEDCCLGSEENIFRWLMLPDKYTGVGFEALALSKGVQVFGAERFTVGNTPPAHAVRLSVCSPDTPEQLEQGLHILAGLLKP